MKGLFGLLLVLSIGFFVLIQWGDELTGVKTGGQMLAELNPEKIVLLDMPVAGKLPHPALPAELSAPAASSVATSLPAASAVAASAPLPASAVMPAVALAKTPAQLSSPTPAPLTPKIVVATVPAAKPAAKACMEWGEFSGGDLARASKSLNALNLGENLAQRNVEYTSGYWVYMPPLKNKAAVKRKIGEIKALGVSDYYVVHEPPKLDNVISLGVFKTSDAAKNFLVSLQKKGIRSAVVGERKQKLKFIVFELRHIDAEIVASLTKLQKDYGYSELTTVSCQN